MVGVMFEVLAIFLMPQKRLMINAIIGTVNRPVFPILLSPMMTMVSLCTVNKMFGIVVSLFLRFVRLEFTILFCPFVSGLSVLTEGASMSIKVEVGTLITLLVVVFFRPCVFVFVMGVFVTFDYVPLFVSFLFFLFQVVFAFICRGKN